MPVSAFSFSAGDVPTAGEVNRMAEAAQPFATYTPTITGVTTSSRTGRHLRHGDLLKVFFSFTLSAAPTAGVTMSLPVTGSNALGLGGARGVIRASRGPTTRIGAVLLLSTTTVEFVSDGMTSAWGPAAPVAWASGDIWTGFLEYEAA